MQYCCTNFGCFDCTTLFLYILEIILAFIFYIFISFIDFHLSILNQQQLKKMMIIYKINSIKFFFVRTGPVFLNRKKSDCQNSSPLKTLTFT